MKKHLFFILLPLLFTLQATHIKRLTFRYDNVPTVISHWIHKSDPQKVGGRNWIPEFTNIVGSCLDKYEYPALEESFQKVKIKKKEVRELYNQWENLEKIYDPLRDSIKKIEETFRNVDEEYVQKMELVGYSFDDLMKEYPVLCRSQIKLRMEYEKENKKYKHIGDELNKVKYEYRINNGELQRLLEDYMAIWEDITEKYYPSLHKKFNNYIEAREEEGLEPYSESEDDKEASYYSKLYLKKRQAYHRAKDQFWKEMPYDFFY